MCIRDSLKGLEVKFPQGSLAEDGIHSIEGEPAVFLLGTAPAVRFLLVGRKMFDAHQHRMTPLHTFCHSTGTRACEEGVFGVILKVPAAQGVPVKVQSWSQPDIHPLGLAFFRYSAAKGPE